MQGLLLGFSLINIQQQLQHRTMANSKRFDINSFLNKPVHASLIIDYSSNNPKSDSSTPANNLSRLWPYSKYSQNSKFRQSRNHKSSMQFEINKHHAQETQVGKPTQATEYTPKSYKILNERKEDIHKWTTLKTIDPKPYSHTHNYPSHKKPLFPKSNTSRIHDFVRIRLLGNGKFGDVYLVKHKQTGFLASLKIIRKIDVMTADPDQRRKAMSQLVSQIKIQAFMNHPNLIKLYDFFEDERCVYLLLELACDGHLLDLLTLNRTFSEESTAIIIRQIVAGIEQMHRNDVIHRDLKLENIVFSHGMAKICDFGWSVYCPLDFRTTFCGTPLYLSPEILQGHRYNKKIDTWAIGTIAYEIFTAENPFNITKKSELSKIVTEDFQMQTGSPEIRNFITSILRKDPAKRPDTQTIQKHPFLVKYKDLQTSEQLCRCKKPAKFKRQYAL